jgi:hypothetical protein
MIVSKCGERVSSDPKLVPYILPLIEGAAFLYVGCDRGKAHALYVLPQYPVSFIAIKCISTANTNERRDFEDLQDLSE